MLIHRRQLLAGSVGLTAALAALPVRAQSKTIPWEKEYDVVIIGSGGAGMATAVSGLENGLKNILLLEKLPYIGGNTSVATGSFNTWSPDQKDQGITDSPEQHATHTMKDRKSVV